MCKNGMMYGLSFFICVLKYIKEIYMNKMGIKFKMKIVKWIAKNQERTLMKCWNSEDYRYAVKITGGIGDALVIARLIRDFQKNIENKYKFDIYYHSSKAVYPIFKGIQGFEYAIDDIEFERIRKFYTFSLICNQFVQFGDEIKFKTIIKECPDIIYYASNIQKSRYYIEAFIQYHPLLDGAFANRQVLFGKKRISWLHDMLGITYGGNILSLPDINYEIYKNFGLTKYRYITVHDGWDAKFKISSLRPTKTIPIEKWKDIICKLHINFPDLPIVQIGGETGDVLEGIDIQLKGKLPFMDSAGILPSSLVHIDCESGLVHLAASLGTRCVVLFGPTNVDWFGYEENINIRPQKCGNCWWSTSTWMDNCPRGYKEPPCIASIDTHQVIEGVYSIISNKGD